MNLGFLASNSGSSMRAIVAAIEAGALGARARIVVSNKPRASALIFAAEHGIRARVIPTVRSPELADQQLADALREAGVDLLILSGYLRKLGPITLAAFRNRILNIHPALLPRHGGSGMYGRRVHEAVLAAGDPVSGATVHVVDEEYDHGEVVAWTEVPVLPHDDSSALESRVTAVEPRLFVQTLQRLAAGAFIFRSCDVTEVAVIVGGCLCGGVRYRLDGAMGGSAGAVTLCHCAQCRKAQGGPAAVGPMLSEALVFTAGRALIREYESSPGKFRAFCARCGSPLYSRRSAKPLDIRLRLGSLDDSPAGLRIEAHIYFDDRAAWEDSADAPKYPALGTWPLNLIPNFR